MPKTNYFNQDTDYILAASKKKYNVYMGSQDTPFIATKLTDLDSNKEKSRYYGRICRPEIRIDNQTKQSEKWTLEKNAAFWAGAIDSQRIFLLATPIDCYLYNNKNKHGKLSCSQFELYWLHQAGYRFAPNTVKNNGQTEDNETQTWCLPPINPLPEAEKHIDLAPDFKVVLSAMKEIKASLEGKKSDLGKKQQIHRF
ncbi:MAG: hypothetical protein HKM04_11030 [Legionellales bacterium]|nr:hypothetical protein [Legionellales bacterium]